MPRASVVVPLAGLQATLDCDLLPLAQVLAADLCQAVPGVNFASLGSATESDLVSVSVAVRGLADAIREGFPLGGVKPPLGNLRDERVKIIDEDEMPGVSGTLGFLFDEDESVFSDFPHGLDVIREERRLRAEEPLIPLQSCCVVRHRDAREQVDCHARILGW
jgi:hypothetical protein